MRKACLFIFNILLIIIFTGCTKNISNIEALNENTYEGFSESEINSAKINIDSVFTDLPSVLEKKYSNFLMPATITIDKGTLYSDIQLEQVSGFDEQAALVFKTLLGDFYTNDLKMETTELVFSKGKTIDNKEKQIYAAVMDNGLVSFMKPAGYVIGFDESYDVIDTIYVDRGDALNETYELSDGSESIQDATDYVLNWINKNWIPYEPDFDYHIKTVKIRKAGDHYMYEMLVEKWFEGIPLDDIMNTKNMVIDANSNMLIKDISSTLYIRMCSMNSVDVFSNGNGIIKVIGHTTEETGWLPLSSCMDMISKLFTDFTIYDIKDIELKYVITPDYTSLDPAQVRFNYKYPGIKMNAYPIWRFIIDKPDEQTDIAGIKNYHIDVNMRTGEVWFELDEKKTK